MSPSCYIELFLLYCMYLFTGHRILGQEKHPPATLKWLPVLYWYCALHEAPFICSKSFYPFLRVYLANEENRKKVPLLHQISTSICTLFSHISLSAVQPMPHNSHQRIVPKKEDSKSCRWLNLPGTRLLICSTRLDFKVFTRVASAFTFQDHIFYYYHHHHRHRHHDTLLTLFIFLSVGPNIAIDNDRKTKEQ